MVKSGRSTPSSSPPRQPVPPQLRRRAFYLVGYCVLLSPILAALLWPGALHRWSRPVLLTLAGVVLISGPVLFVLLRPLLNHEAERSIAVARGQPWSATQWRRGLLGGLGVLAASAVLWYLFLDHAWRPPLARAAGIVGYFAVFLPLAQWHRRGISPYWRPHWYGFLLAGLGGAATWTMVASGDLVEGLVGGVTWALMHYGLTRMAMRRIERRHAA